MIKKFSIKTIAFIVMISTIFILSACKQDKIPDVETVSRYSSEELINFASTVDEQTLINSWGEPLTANNERLWPVDLTGGTKYMVAYVEAGKVISLNFSTTMFINVVMIKEGVTYCTFGRDYYSSDTTNLAFMPTQDVFGNGISCEVGDQILFETDGMVMETYPAQIPSPYSVRLMGHLSDEEMDEMTVFKTMNSDDIEALRNQTSFTWDDFSAFDGEDIGSGLFIFRYDLLDGGYMLVSGTSMDQDPQQVLFCHPDGTEEIIFQSSGFVGATTSDTWQRVEVAPSEGSLCTISFMLPEGWDYSITQTEDVPVSGINVAIYPVAEGDARGCVVISYTQGFGVCGTGLVTEETTFNNHAASIGTYDDHPYWDYIALMDPYQGCVILNQAEWYEQYQDEINDILSTVAFTIQEQ